MARILIGVCGVGYGHAIRSGFLIEELSEKNDVMIVSSFAAYPYLKSKFKKVHKVDGLEFAFKANKVMSLNTIFKNIRKISGRNYSNLKRLKARIDQFKPEIVISDWELFSIYYARDRKVNLLAFDNEHYLLEGEYNTPKGYKLSYWKACVVINMYRVKNMICVLLPEQKLKNDSKAYGVMPIIRKRLIGKKTSKNNFVLVYKSVPQFDPILGILKECKENFIIYGYDFDKKEDNLTFKKFSENGFLKDLLSCKAVICSAGMGLIAEALYVKKPLLVMPVKNHFEQELNAIYVKENNFGDFCEHLSKENINKFLANKYKTISFKPGNKNVLDIVNDFIKRSKNGN